VRPKRQRVTGRTTGRALAIASVAWALSACVGQLQFDPSQTGLSGDHLPGSGGSSGSGSGGSTGGTSPGTGGAASSDDAGTPDASLQAPCPSGFDVVNTVFKSRCGGCYGAAAPTENLDLVTMGIGTRTVGATSTCNNKPLISTTLVNGQATGHLLDKLAGPVTGCGVQMPAGGTPLTSTEMACVQQWAVAAVQAVAGSGGGY